MKELRPFEDLIKTIEVDGKVFCPIEAIAKLAVCVGTLKGDKNPLISYFNAYWSGFDSFGHCFKIVIDKIFDIELYFDHDTYIVSNQVQIVKNLIKWGFVEP